VSGYLPGWDGIEPVFISTPTEHELELDAGGGPRRGTASLLPPFKDPGGTYEPAKTDPQLCA